MIELLASIADAVRTERYTPAGVSFVEVAAVAVRSARRWDRPEVIHAHARGAPCHPICAVVVR